MTFYRNQISNFCLQYPTIPVHVNTVNKEKRYGVEPFPKYSEWIIVLVECSLHRRVFFVWIHRWIEIAFYCFTNKLTIKLMQSCIALSFAWNSLRLPEMHYRCRCHMANRIPPFRIERIDWICAAVISRQKFGARIRRRRACCPIDHCSNSVRVTHVCARLHSQLRYITHFDACTSRRRVYKCLCHWRRTTRVSRCAILSSGRIFFNLFLCVQLWCDFSNVWFAVNIFFLFAKRSPAKRRIIQLIEA